MEINTAAIESKILPLLFFGGISRIVERINAARMKQTAVMILMGTQMDTTLLKTGILKIQPARSRMLNRNTVKIEIATVNPEGDNRLEAKWLCPGLYSDELGDITGY
jgi:hypothetical protein